MSVMIGSMSASFAQAQTPASKAGEAVYKQRCAACHEQTNPPTLDAKRGLMYVATGDNYSTPATGLSDAIVALEIGTGRVVWSRQTTPGDAYNSSCGTDKQNCPDEDGPD